MDFIHSRFQTELFANGSISPFLGVEKGTADSPSGENPQKEVPRRSGAYCDLGKREKARKAGDSRRIREQFSELQTVWRGDRHSNPQSPFEKAKRERQVDLIIADPPRRALLTDVDCFRVARYPASESIVVIARLDGVHRCYEHKIEHAGFRNPHDSLLPLSEPLIVATQPRVTRTILRPGRPRGTPRFLLSPVFSRASRDVPFRLPGGPINCA